MRRIGTFVLALLLALAASPAFADSGTFSSALGGPPNDAPVLETPASATPLTPGAPTDISAQDYTPATPLVNGTYVFDRFTSSTGMTTPNTADSPAKAVVDGDEVVLTLDLYNPDKYDGLWLGKRSQAPVDPYSGEVTTAIMVPADGYAGSTNIWEDADGLVGEAGAKYKAARFIMYLTLGEFQAALADEGRFYFAVRRAVWSPSNAGKWMGSADNYFTLSGPVWESASTEVPGEGAYATGTYEFDRFSSSTGMVTTNNADAPATAVIKGDRVALILSVYNPDKYDGLWAGKRTEAPADPYDSSVASATMVPAGDYAGTTNIWTDAGGLVGEPGASYKAARFVMVMGKSDFIAMVENGVDEDFPFAIRRAPWSPSNAGKWMGSGNHYFSFGNLTKVSRSTEVPGGFPSGEGASALERVKRLIDALPYDPYKVKLADAAAIQEAQDAFARLSSIDQLQLDVQGAANGVLTYGRTLECASWGLKALSPVDDSTTLQDGTYTTQVTSTCEMGKSSSRRGYKFSVSKVVVAGGHATATLEHATSSPDTLSMGGVLYAHVNADEKAHSAFEVPIDLNSTFYFSQMAKNPTANTIAIPYEMTTSIDEANAVPDPPETVDGSTPTAEPAAAAEPAAETGKKSSKSSKKSAARKADEADAPAPVVTVTRKSGGSGGAGAGASGNAPVPGSEVVPAERSAVRMQQAATEGAATPEAEVGDGGDRADVAPLVTGAAAVLAVMGAAFFALDYLRRERRPIRIRGVRLTKEGR